MLTGSSTVRASQAQGQRHWALNGPTPRGAASKTAKATVQGWGSGLHGRWGPPRCRPGRGAGPGVGPPPPGRVQRKELVRLPVLFQGGLASPVPASGSRSSTTTPRPTRSSAPRSGTTSPARWLSRCLGRVPAPPRAWAAPPLGGTGLPAEGTRTCFLPGLRARPGPPHQGHGPVPAPLERLAVPVHRALVFLRPDGVPAHLPPLRSPRGPPSCECRERMRLSV